MGYHRDLLGVSLTAAQGNSDLHQEFTISLGLRKHFHELCRVRREWLSLRIPFELPERTANSALVDILQAARESLFRNEHDKTRGHKSRGRSQTTPQFRPMAWAMAGT